MRPQPDPTRHGRHLLVFARQLDLDGAVREEQRPLDGRPQLLIDGRADAICLRLGSRLQAGGQFPEDFDAPPQAQTVVAQAYIFSMPLPLDTTVMGEPHTPQKQRC